MRYFGISGKSAFVATHDSVESTRGVSWRALHFQPPNNINYKLMII